MLDKPKCYNCEKEMEVHPPYFCSEKCKLEYWHESPTQPQTRTPKSIPEIQARLRAMAMTAKPEEDSAADFMAHIVTQPVPTSSLPYRD